MHQLCSSRLPIPTQHLGGHGDKRERAERERQPGLGREIWLGVAKKLLSTIMESRPNMCKATQNLTEPDRTPRIAPFPNVYKRENNLPTPI